MWSYIKKKKQKNPTFQVPVGWPRPCPTLPRAPAASAVRRMLRPSLGPGGRSLESQPFCTCQHPGPWHGCRYPRPGLCSFCLVFSPGWGPEQMSRVRTPCPHPLSAQGTGAYIAPTQGRLPFIPPPPPGRSSQSNSVSSLQGAAPSLMGGGLCFHKTTLRKYGRRTCGQNMQKLESQTRASGSVGKKDQEGGKK